MKYVFMATVITMLLSCGKTNDTSNEAKEVAARSQTDSAKLKSRFDEIIAKVETGPISAREKTELESLASTFRVPIVPEDSLNGNSRDCMWVCDNNFSCNPSSPPPNCGTCKKICW